jgi:hypothetical protein
MERTDDAITGDIPSQFKDVVNANRATAFGLISAMGTC